MSADRQPHAIGLMRLGTKRWRFSLQIRRKVCAHRQGQYNGIALRQEQRYRGNHRSFPSRLGARHG